MYFNFTETDDFAKSVRSLATEFSPMSEKQEAELKNSDAVLKALASKFRETAPNSCFMRLYDLVGPEKTKSSGPMPPSIPDMVKQLDKDQTIDTQVETLLKAIQLNPDQRCLISQQTKDQSFSADWKSQKNGRITASISQRCYTRARTLMQKPEADPTAVISEVLQYKETPCNAAMKYGLSNEPRAKLALNQIMKKRKHQKFTASDTGLMIHETPYIGASPDLLVECACHGKGIVEIKCPQLFDKITAENYDHLIECDGKLKLKHTSPYFYQIQHQLGVTGRNHGYFFVYTNKDFVLDEIKFDIALWQDMLDKFDYLWRKHIAPEIIQRTILRGMKENQGLFHGHEYAACEGSAHSGHGSQYNRPSLLQQIKSKEQPKPYLTKPHYGGQFLCSYCGLHLPDEPDDQDGASIECSACGSWWHFTCLDYEPMETSGIWLCPNCNCD